MLWDSLCIVLLCFSGAQRAGSQWLWKLLAWICALYPRCNLRLKSCHKNQIDDLNAVLNFCIQYCAYFIVYILYFCSTFALLTVHRPSDPYPSVTGPHCAQSYYGCCPDGHTAASGPRGEGCAHDDCHRSRYRHIVKLSANRYTSITEKTTNIK